MKTSDTDIALATSANIDGILEQQDENVVKN